MAVYLANGPKSIIAAIAAPLSVATMAPIFLWGEWQTVQQGNFEQKPMKNSINFGEVI
jgi:hypothetical protein